jgi:ribose transport system substrate-binding protein
MRRLRLGATLAIIGLTGIALAACGSDDDGEAEVSPPVEESPAETEGTNAVDTADSSDVSSPAAAADDPVTVEFIGADIGDPFYVAMQCGAQDAAEEFNVDLTWGGITGVDFAEELTAFNAAVQRGPQGIITAPFDAQAFIEPIQSAMDSGIPVVTVDGSLNEPVELQNIRTDNAAAGGVAADAMAELISEGEVAVISFSPSVPVPKARVDGFVERAEAEYPGLNVVAVEYSEADAAIAAQKASALMQRFPDLAGIYATDTTSAEGVASAILAADKRGEIRLISFDAGPKAVEGLTSGLYDGLIAQSPYDEGYEAVKILAQVIRGEVDPADVENQKWTGAFFVNLDNLETPEAQQAIYQAEC